MLEGSDLEFYRRARISTVLVALVLTSRKLTTAHAIAPDAISGPADCSLYFAESSVQPGRYGLYSTVDRPAGELLTAPDLFIPITDANKNEWSPWHDFVRRAETFPNVYGETDFWIDLFYPGVGSMIACSNKFMNVVPVSNETINSAGVHRSKDPTFGSFTYYHNSMYKLNQSVQAGEELVLSCHNEQDTVKSSGQKVLSLDFLRETAICLNSLATGPSTIAGAGRGAFATRHVKEGGVIASSPLIYFDRSQMDVVENKDYSSSHFTPIQREHGIVYNNSNVLGKQLLLNYCYGQHNSNILLLPYAPGVNFINHGGKERSNAYVRWSTNSRFQGSNLKQMRPMQLLSIPVGEEEPLVMEFVAKRSITPGEEILIDYGVEWRTEWEEHVATWAADHRAETYISSDEYSNAHRSELFRTLEDQKSNIYPDNLQTVCYFELAGSDIDKEEVEWYESYSGCLRPCDIESIYTEDDKDDGETFYTVIMYNSESANVPDICGTVPPTGLLVHYVPADAITFIDQPYTTDAQSEGAFRHEIGLPSGFLPSAWDATDPKPEGDFAGHLLGPGEMAPVVWKESGEVVSPWAFRLGLTSRIREVLLDYCDKKGITKVLRHVTLEGNGFLPGQESVIFLDGQQWYLQRPGKHWNSNLHWLSPNDDPSHEDYLQALSLAGFDDMLRSIGEYLGLDGLVAYHVTFIAVTHSIQGFMHLDVSKTNAKAYNVIIPLILANDTGPELDLEGGPDRAGPVGRYRYEYDVAALMGDDAFHATSAVDYRSKAEMRLAATVYIADVNEDNVDSIADHYTQAFPPNDVDLLMSWAGRHWKSDDPMRKLPKPRQDHILLRSHKHHQQDETSPNSTLHSYYKGKKEEEPITSSSEVMGSRFRSEL